MSAVLPSRILVCAEPSDHADDLCRQLEQAGHVVVPSSLNGIAADLFGCRALVLEANGSLEPSLEFCRRFRSGLADGFVPLLFVTSDPSPKVRLACLDAGADTYLSRPLAAGELSAQLHALLRIKEVHDRLSEKAAEVHRMNHRLQAAYQQLDSELELAQRLQMSFLPHALPEVPRARFAVCYQLCGRVGGDFYDVFRLDENHVGFYVADAMGHGVPASLLTIFIKKGVQGKEIFGKQYRLLPPGEVLQRLNHDFVELALSEQPFVTMVYVLFDFQTGTLQFARAGHPHPLYLPRHGEPQLWQIHGSLLGVFDTEYTTQLRWLRPGDKLLLYSDGIENASFEGHAPGAASLVACATRHRGLPIDELVNRVASDLRGGTQQSDDLTLLGVEMGG